MIPWSYDTKAEPVPEGVTLNPRVIEINGMPWQARSDCRYRTDYYKLFDRCAAANNFTKEEATANPLENQWNLFNNVIKTDLWFFVYFCMKNPLANHPFIVEACKEVQNDQGDTLHEWARDHLKTTIISVARTCQKVFNDPEKRIAIFSASRPLAIKIQNLIKALFEDKFLYRCFPYILWEDPKKDAPKWSEAPEGGLVVKREGFYKEATISSWGLVEGMPTGDHFTDINYDDIVHSDYISPDMVEKICFNFDMSENLGTRDVQRTVVGTPYRHDDSLAYIREASDPDTGLRRFKNVRKPATVDGTFRGASVFLPERTLAKKRAGAIYIFYCQQLVDPTPRGREKLNKNHMQVISKRELPENLYKFLLVDGSGDQGKRKDRKADPWAFGVIGVRPYMDEIGLSDIYVLDLRIEELDLVQAQDAIVEMFCRNGYIRKLGIEKVGMSTTEIHIQKALAAKKRFVSIEAESLVILNPSGRSKEYRIESALTKPLRNGKIHILDSVPIGYRDRLGKEMEKFPAWHDDGLDMLSYVYDIIKDYRFGEIPKSPAEQQEDAWDRKFREARERGLSRGWQSC